MLQEATDLQKGAVEKLLIQCKQKDEVTFKAPTGSGKTYMMADFMNRVLSDNPDVVFLVSTLSKGDLATQNYEKFCDYSARSFFPHLKPYLIKSETAEEARLFIPTDYNVYLLPRDLYKKGGRLMLGAMENFLKTLTSDKMYKGLEKKIYLIKDECHIATTNLDNLSAKNFAKIINFSATPNLRRGQTPDVEIKDEDAVAASLIKNVEFGAETDTVADAVRKFEEIKVDYRNILGVNPCLIIQISNKDKADYELNNVIFPILNKSEHQALKWMLIVDDEKACDTNDSFKAKKLPVSKWKDYAKQSAATIDVIIFKMVISEGWDIPRACMLYQVRDTKSAQLDEQVMGRVRRNPRLMDFETLSPQARRLATTAWIWGLIPEEKKKVFGVSLFDEPEDVTDELKVKTTKLKKLTNREDFDLHDFISAKPTPPVNTDIFSLFRNLNKADNAVKEMCYSYSDSYDKWWDFTEHINEISKESRKYICDYSQSMEVCKDSHGNESLTSFPSSSFYFDNGNYMDINEWVWRRSDGEDNFSFDSEAEQKWARVLEQLSAADSLDGCDRAVKRVVTGKNAENPTDAQPKKINPKKKSLWGKNYLYNSEIKFEYYLEGIHSSYPDFIMKDYYGRIHIFEVKSVNKSKDISDVLDGEKYEAKINELKKCYKQASVLTQQIFYVPVLSGEDWQITQFIEGNERTLSKKQFIEFVINKPAA